ncbi:hypothetical protein [Paracoccus methylarcula]|uniref:Uncharacterized protein n=1 Tax=Paracoccus methylarcula TaxID=72022 RepID=A0A422QY18_9RHOB|nr:hypothetical protein [Paracoccus methylarcula]RNF34878.1 hypothetical protein A7A09_007690 [Paracoccus methylarcula]
MRKLSFAVVGIAALSACSIDPKQWETEPVTVETPNGRVVCQLYSPDIVRWDRAIERPENMSVKTADAYCHNEGVKQQGM